MPLTAVQVPIAFEERWVGIVRAECPDWLLIVAVAPANRGAAWTDYAPYGVRTPVDEEECALYRVFSAFYDQTGVLT